MVTLTEHNQKWWILFAMTSCIAMIFIDITVLPITLPTLQRTLNISPIGLQWIVNAYTLTLTIFVLAAGRFGDRLGHRRVFCWGIFFFTLGSALCGLSNYEWWFISARVIQGFGGSMLIPTSAAIIFAAFPAHQRGKAIGMYVSIGSVFLALGPFIGGLFTQHLSWRYVFWINLPIGLIGFLLTLFAVPQIKGKHRSFDLFGFLTSSLGISSIVIAFMNAKRWGWSSPITLGLIGFGLILICLLLIIDRKIEDPYIDLSLFKNGNFLGAISAVFTTQFFLMVTVFWAIYFQTVYGYTPSQAGAISLASNLPVIAAAPIGGHLLDKHGPRLPIVLGFSLTACSLFWFLQNLENSNLWIILSAIVPFGCGIPLIFTPSFTTAMAEVAAEKRGMASGTATMLRQLAATLGLALMGSIFLTLQEGQFAKELQKNNATLNTDPGIFEGLLSKSPPALEALAKLPAQAQEFVQNIFLNSYIEGFWGINVLALIIALIGLILSLSFIKKKKKQPDIGM